MCMSKCISKAMYLEKLKRLIIWNRTTLWMTTMDGKLWEDVALLAAVGHLFASGCMPSGILSNTSQAVVLDYQFFPLNQATRIPPIGPRDDNEYLKPEIQRVFTPLRHWYGPISLSVGLLRSKKLDSLGL